MHFGIGVAKNLKLPDFSVLIVGGGFSGAALAIQLLGREPGLPVAMVDRGPAPGRGLAYSSKYRFHLLNVPAGNMTALPDDPNSFLRWARNKFGDSIRHRSFLSRSVYGDYVGALLDEAIARGGTRFRWVQDEALSLRCEHSHVKVQLKQGGTLSARVVVLATGNFPPANLRIPGLSERSERYFGFAWSAAALENLPPDGSVLLVGSGLTSLDLIIGLRSKGFRGSIHVISRRGLIPQSYLRTSPWPLYWNEHSPRTTRGLLRLIRDEVRRASAAGVGWRSVIDVLRPLTPSIWQSLPLPEQRRFLRHVRPYWEAVRHRVATEISDIISDLLHAGQLTIYAGRLTDYRELRRGAEVRFRERKSGANQTLVVDRVINCSGSETDCRRIDDSLIMSLFAQGLARPDPLFLGLDVDNSGALLDFKGVPSTSLYTIGPTRKGHLWETTAVPEIRMQAAELAELLLHRLVPEHRPDSNSGGTQFSSIATA